MQYKVKKVKEGWQVVRPDDSIVNEATFKTESQAELKLNQLIVFG